MSSRFLTVAVTVLVVCILAAVPVGVVVSQELMEVVVTNFPNPQNVTGTVEVQGPIRQAELVAVRDLVVSPVQASDTTRWVDGGIVVTDGFPFMVLSLNGVVKGEVNRSGTVGAVLLPDDEGVMRAFDLHGQLQFPFEVTAPSVSSASPYFASQSIRVPVAFPRYRIWLYNSSDRTVNVSLFAYLTSG